MRCAESEALRRAESEALRRADPHFRKSLSLRLNPGLAVQLACHECTSTHANRPYPIRSRAMRRKPQPISPTPRRHVQRLGACMNQPGCSVGKYLARTCAHARLRRCTHCSRKCAAESAGLCGRTPVAHSHQRSVASLHRNRLKGHGVREALAAGDRHTFRSSREVNSRAKLRPCNES